jgi:hypothetical protein
MLLPLVPKLYSSAPHSRTPVATVPALPTENRRQSQSSVYQTTENITQGMHHNQITDFLEVSKYMMYRPTVFSFLPRT